MEALHFRVGGNPGPKNIAISTYSPPSALARHSREGGNPVPRESAKGTSLILTKSQVSDQLCQGDTTL